MTKYKKRIVDTVLKEMLEASGAVLIEGPKWCGKTTTAEQQAGSVVYMNDPETSEANLLAAATNAKRLLRGITPRLIDEWQLAPRLWDAIRFEIDHRDVHTGQFILTGSAVPADTEQIQHSGAGRFSWLTMHTMSLWESEESTGEVSIRDLMEGAKADAGEMLMTAEKLAFIVCRGGWPASVTLSHSAALRQAENYLDAICNTDISRVDGVRRDSSFCRRFLRSYARHQGTQATMATLRADIVASTLENISEGTISSYLQALRKIFVIEDIPAWNPNMRSKSAIRTSPTRYFTDPSIAAVALGIGPNDLLDDMKTFGFVFEAMAIRDLRIYAQALGGQVYHFRDRNGLECDAVIHLRNGKYGLVEIKLGGEKLIEEGAASLLRLASKIDTDSMKAPAFMMVVIGIGQYAYTRADGVHVVPLSCLKE